MTQRLLSFLHQRRMQQRLGSIDLSGVCHDHFHHAFAGEHLEHQLHVADGGIVDAGEFQEQGLPRCRFLLGLGFRNAALQVSSTRLKHSSSMEAVSSSTMT